MSFPNPDNYARDCDCGTSGANTTPPPASLVAEVEVQNLLSSRANPANAGSGNIYAKYGAPDTEEGLPYVVGNARGVGSVDLQQTRQEATQVASGNNCTISGGRANTASGNFYNTVGGGVFNQATNNSDTVSGGAGNIASGGSSTVGGGSGNIASGGSSTISGGILNSATEQYSFINGGIGAVADRFGMGAYGCGNFISIGDAQAVSFVMRNATSNANFTELFLDGSNTRLTIPSNKILSCVVNITGIQSTRANAAHYIRKVSIKNNAGTVSLVGTVSTIGPDVEENPAWDVNIVADNTYKSLSIQVKGAVSNVIRWVAVVQGIEILY
jgi:hypothetical protein